MQHRILCLYFPRLAMDRLERDSPALASRPLAVVRDERGHPWLAAVNTPARQAGIRSGMRLADARALLPGIDIVQDRPEADHDLKQRLLEWCNRYSPLTAHDGDDGIVLDIAGCAHLFGGEAALLDDLQSRVQRMKIHVRGAIAPTPAAAWALARFGKQLIVTSDDLPAALDPLPVRALRIVPEIAVELGRVGLTAIGMMRRVPRQSLAARYGPNVVLRLDQALGSAEEPVTPYRQPPPYRAVRAFAEPIGTTLSVEHALLELLTEICSKLEKDHRGARRLDLGCYRVDGSVADVQVRTSRPGRSLSHLMRLYAEKLNSLDAGFGIETMILSASEVDDVEPVQMTLPHTGDGIEDETSLDEMLDRVGLRLGFQQVCRFRIRESLLPEYSVELVPVIHNPGPGAEWPETRVRPVRLIDPPMRIEVAEIVPGKWPVMIRIGRELHRVVRMEGPERLTPEWWRDEPALWEMRDYYRIENDHGARLWIFRETRLSPQRESWFLHGHLP